MKRFLLLTLTLFSLSFAAGARYLIITHDNFYNTIQPLAQWKQKKGVATKVVKLSEIPANPSDISLIKNYIVNAYNTWNPRPDYVLLVGASPTYINTDASADDYYGNMTGDYKMEIPVGRLPCTNVSECSLMVSKTLGYERTPYVSDPNWFIKGTTIVKEDDDPIDDSIYWADARYCASQMRNAGFAHVDTFSRLLGNNAANVENAITDGRSYVVYRGYWGGGVNWASPFVVDVNNMNCGFKLPIVISGTCTNMSLSGSLYLGEKFMRAGTVTNPKGAVGYFGTTQAVSDVARFRGAVSKGFFCALFSEKTDKLGDVAKRAKFILDSIYTGQPGYSSARYREWNLYGDPELNLWTSTPRVLTVTHDTIIFSGGQTYNVTVKIGTAPLYGAAVCLMMDTVIYQTKYTNSSGIASFSITPPAPETISVTVTAKNCAPYEKNVIVIPGGLTHDVGVLSIIEPVSNVAAGNVVYPKVLIKNFGTVRDTFPVTFKIGSVYTQTISQVILAAGDTVTKTFSIPWTAVMGNYQTKAYTALSSDQWRGNDTAFGSFNVVAAHDVGVTAILAPKDTIANNITITPKAIIQNFGGNSESFNATFKINGGYSQTVLVNLSVGITDTIDFPNWTSSIGSYTTQCYSSLGTDGNHSNDTINGSVYVRSEFLVEGFNETAFPPSGWTSTILSGTVNWDRATSGSTPPCTPYEGAGMAFYNSYSAPTGNGARLLSSPIVLGSSPINIQIKFNMYHDDQYPGGTYGPDSVIVEYSTNGTTFNRIAGFRRYEPTNGWSEHALTIGPFSGTIYIAFRAFSEYGDNIYVDNVRVMLPPPGDVGVYSIQSPQGRIPYGTPQDVIATLKNYGGSQATFPSRATVTDSILGTTVFTKDTTLTLNLSETAQIDFGQFTPQTNKIYKVVVYTAYNADAYRSNDTMKTRARTTPNSEPDGAGYTYQSNQDAAYGDTATYNWFDATTGTLLSGWTPNAEDGNLTVTLPFSFPFYGQSLSSINVSTNGFLQTPTTYVTNPNRSLPFSSINNFIGGLWDDLDIRSAYAPGSRAYQYNDPSNQFVVFAYESVPRFNQVTQRNSFEIILYRDGRIKYQYRRVATVCQTGSTIGIQGGTGTNNYYLQYVFDGTPASHVPTNGTAILFSPSIDVGTLQILSPANAVDSGAVVIPSAVVHNYGPTRQSLDIKFDINDGYTHTKSISVPSLSDTTIYFNSWTARYFGTFTTKCSTRFAQDLNTGNDKTSGTVRVRFYDVGAFEIVSPNDTQFISSLPVTAKIKNYYTRTASCSTRFVIRDTLSVIQFNQVRYSAGILPESIRTISFGNFNASLGKYYTQVYTKLATDDNPSNDTISDWFAYALAFPVLSSPAQSESVRTSTPLFTWQTVSGASRYQVQIDNDNDFMSPDIDINVYSPQYQVPAPGLDLGVYYWRVRAGLPYGWWSEIREFIISRTPTSAMWTRISANVPTLAPGKLVKDGGSLMAVRDSLYAFRGNKSKEFYLYNGSSWIRKESIPFGKKPNDIYAFNKKTVAKGGALCFDGSQKIYATKGNSTREFWVYYILKDSWAAKAFVSVPKGLKGGTSIVYYNGKVYLLAGDQRYGESNFFVYDTTANTWSPLLSAPMVDYKPYKDGSCVTLLNGKIYALKGSGKHNYFAEYNIATNTWTNKETIPLLHPRIWKKNTVKSGGAIANDGSKIYATKGGGKNEFWRYTPGTPGIWTAIDTIPKLNSKSVTKIGAALAYADGKVYLLKGNNTDEFWQYTPASDVVTVTPSTTQSVMTENTMSILKPNFEITPNPIKDNYSLRFNVPVSGKVMISLFNSTGQLIETMLDDYLNAGSYSIKIQPETGEIPKGIYFLRYKDINNKFEIKLIKL